MAIDAAIGRSDRLPQILLISNFRNSGHVIPRLSYLYVVLEKLDAIQARWEEISRLIVQPEVVSDHKQYSMLSKEYKRLETIVKKYERYKNLLSNISFNKELVRSEKDDEMLEMAKAELEENEAEKVELEEELKQMLIPRDPEDDKDIIIEIRAGTGGDEAAIFAGDLFRMYKRFFEGQGWKVEMLTMNEAPTGGYKEISASVTGEEVYGLMKFEAGVHRVQRVPVTESQGRVHTSAASVAIMPEVDDVDVNIDEKDIRRDTYRASGAGGQHVNKTESAVRLTHIPTGVVAECQDGRSQHKNYEMAMKMLRARIYEQALAEHQAEIAARRKTMVSTGDRSAKIRTYNYPQGRVTDHRINLTLYNLQAIIDGDISEIIEKLKLAENTEKMKEQN